MPDIVEPPIKEEKPTPRTEEQKKAAADACIHEIIQNLAKHNCRVIHTHIIDSEGQNRFKLSIRTND